MQTKKDIIIKPKYPIRNKPTVRYCPQWDDECPAYARLFLARIGMKEY